LLSFFSRGNCLVILNLIFDFRFLVGDRLDQEIMKPYPKVWQGQYGIRLWLNPDSWLDARDPPAGKRRACHRQPRLHGSKASPYVANEKLFPYLRKFNDLEFERSPVPFRLIVHGGSWALRYRCFVIGQLVSSPCPSLFRRQPKPAPNRPGKHPRGCRQSIGDDSASRLRGSVDAPDELALIKRIAALGRSWVKLKRLPIH
jgi:hypothetical protein